MEMEKLQINVLAFAKGLKNKGLIDISEDKEDKDKYVIIVGQAIHRQWGIFSLPKGIWRVTCRKEEVKEVVDKLLTEKILID